MKNILYLLVISLFFSSCSKQLYTRNSAHNNTSFSSNQYDINEISFSEEGKAIFGIPIQKSSKKSGFIFNFNGVKINKTPKILPILSLLSLNFSTGLLMAELGVGKEQTRTELRYNNFQGYYEKEVSVGRTPNIQSYLLGFPIAAIINNAIWPSSIGAAGANINVKLIETNPDIDMFIYPKYNIEYSPGIFNQKATVNLDLKGVTLKKDQ